MRVGIHQLHYLPWLRYFEKIARCDVFIVLDNIQFNKNGWQNRNKVKTAAGSTLLTVPVYDKLAQTLEMVMINNTVAWNRKHNLTLRQAYAKAPFLGQYALFFEDVYGRSWERLNDLNRHMLDYLVRALGITTRIVYASELQVPGVATERLINLIKAVDGTHYYSGAYALDAYLDAAQLAKAGIELVLQEWRAPTYPQLHGAFVSDLSVIDLLLNCGPTSLRVLLGEPT